jgi:hypothetical protein
MYLIHSTLEKQLAFGVDLRSHWKAANIKDVLRGTVNEQLVKIKGGERYFHFGYLIGKQNDPNRYLQVGQKYLIRFAIENRCVLLNKNLTKIKSHELHFSGSKSGRDLSQNRRDRSKQAERRGVV